MRTGINLALIALIGLLVWVLIDSIREPIKFKAEKERRKTAVVDRLVQIRGLQDIYRDVTGEFASDFDSLRQVIQTGKVQKISVFGDPDAKDATDAIRYDTTFEAAMVSVRQFEENMKMEINLDSISYVPFSKKGAQFDIWADTLTYQSTLVNVVEVSTTWKEFMGPFASNRYRKYDDNYDPSAPLKFGDRNAPNTSGNWER